MKLKWSLRESECWQQHEIRANRKELEREERRFTAVENISKML